MSQSSSQLSVIPPAEATPTDANGIAIVGAALRFPGDLQGLDALWGALVGGADLVTEIPSSRWATDTLQHPRREEPGRSVTYAAGVLADIEAFDPGFFGIAPREAEKLDPQQRLAIELAWHALESAGIPPSRLAGTDCGVYLGISSLDYGMGLFDDLSSISAHSMTGNTMSVAANRLSYLLDLHGPSLAIDTACSSSLVALHHACEALHRGECTTALVGGVNLLLHPYSFVGFTKAHMLSAAGRCQPFAEGADGYVRAEGGAVVVLKPLAQAQADGDVVHAVIRATGNNTDGARKSALTIPSNTAQQALLAGLLQKSGLSPDDIDYVEAHGTGTAVGDPAEAGAIAQVLGQPRGTGALPIGSIKSNLGHMESAAGMAGLIKAMLVLKHGVIPPTLHARALNPQIDWQASNLTLIRETTPLPERDRPWRAGVNSFGFGGANAHVILEAAPLASADQPAHHIDTRAADEPPPPLFLSTQSTATIGALAGAYHEQLAASPEALADIAWNAAYRRDWLAHRWAVFGERTEALQANLAELAAGNDRAEGIVYEKALATPARIAFIYSGNGAQWVGMGVALAQQSTVFADTLDALEPHVLEHGGWSLKEALAAPAEESRLDQTAVAQPLIFAVQVGITRMLAEAGIEPAWVMGHSVGEAAAAWAAGIYDLATATRLVCHRSAAQQAAHGRGKMLAINRAWPEIEQLLATLNLEQAGVECAAVNAPDQLTLAGDAAALRRIADYGRANGFFARVLDLDYAFHSRAMDPIEADLRERLAGLQGQPATRSFVSSVTGKPCEGTELNADYWWQNVRAPVAFESATRDIVAAGGNVLIEIGPEAILQRYLSRTADAVGKDARIIPTLRRNADDPSAIMAAAYRAHLLCGLETARHRLPDEAPTRALPLMPFERGTFWNQPTPEAYSLMKRRRVHPLLGYALKESALAWENPIDTATLPYLADHRVGEAAVMPAAGYAELAIAAAMTAWNLAGVDIESLEIRQPLVFEGNTARLLRTWLDPEAGRFVIQSRPRLSDAAWTEHARGRVLGAPSGPAAKPEPASMPSGAEPARLDAATHYARAQRVGLDYGSTFQGIDWIEQSPHELNAQFDLPASVAEDTHHHCHPAVLDLCFQSLISHPALDTLADRGLAMLPVAIGRLRWYAQQGQATHCHATIQRQGPQSLKVDCLLTDANDSTIAQLTGCRFRLAALVRPASPVPRWVSQRVATAMHVERRWPALPSADPPPTRSTAETDFIEEGRPLLDAYIAAAAFEAWQARFGTTTTVTQTDLATASTDEVAAGWALWLANRLSDGGWLQATAEGWQPGAQPPPPPADEIWRTLLNDFPALAPELILLGRLSGSFPVLLGAADPQAASVSSDLQAIMTESPHTASLLAASASVRDRDRWLTRALDALTKDDARGPLRILQAGAPGVTIAGATPIEPSLSALEALEGATFDLVVWADDHAPAADRQSVAEQLARRVRQGGRLLIAGLRPAPYWQALMAAWHGVAPDACVPTSPAGWATAEPLEDDRGLPQSGWVTLARPPASAAPVRPRLTGRHGLLPLTAADQAETTALRDQIASAGGTAEVVDATTLPDALPRLDSLTLVFPTVASPTAPDPEWINTALQLSGATAEREHPPVVNWLLPGGAPVGEHDHETPANISPANSALWRLGRVVMNEWPAIDLQLIDADPSATSGEVALIPALSRAEAEREWVLRGATAQALRVAPDEPIRHAAPADTHYALAFDLPGQLRNLHWQPTSARAPGHGEVEVSVRAVGLNFRDVMYALGLLSDDIMEDGFAGATMGLECAGVVTRIGAGVVDFAPGDEVLGFAPQCFASHVVTPASAIRPKPGHWSFAEAATVPTVFFTAWYALIEIGHLQPGERVLIHGAAGGVGLAAIAIARERGAEVFATAGSDEKRDFLRQLGVSHIHDSRSLAFADEIHAATDGVGVDVVLNSLAGEAMHRSLQVLRPFGRFLELGKRDFVEDTRLGLRPFRNNLSYFGIDADQLMAERPDLTARVFADLMAWMGATGIGPLPHRVFSADEVVTGFRYMQQARQIGKVVISLDEPAQLPAPRAAEGVPIRGDGTYLVTGGTAGLGFATARWLLDAGAGRVVAISRRGAETPGLGDRLAELGEAASRFEARAGDVSDRAAMADIIDALSNVEPPLRGVFHAAAVLDDALLSELDTSRVQSVIEAKARSAEHLHDLTQDQALEAFVLFSSVTTWLGNPGQGNYVAANGYLDGLAARRRAEGLPATCINWGPIGDTGMLSDNATVRDLLESRLGGTALTAAEAMEALGKSLAEDRSSIAISPLDWHALAPALPIANTPLFAPVREAAKPTHQPRHDALGELSALPEAEAIERVAGWISEEVAGVLGLAPEKIDRRQSLFDMGLDSLMAVELGLALEKRLGHRVPPLALGEGATTEALARRLWQDLASQADAPDDDDEQQTLLNRIAEQHGEGLDDVMLAKLREDQ